MCPIFQRFHDLFALLAGCCTQQAMPCCTPPLSPMHPSGSVSCSRPSVSARNTQALLLWSCHSGLGHARLVRCQLRSILRLTALARRCWRRGGRLHTGWRHQTHEVGRRLHSAGSCCTCIHEMDAASPLTVAVYHIHDVFHVAALQMLSSSSCSPFSPP